MLALQHALHEGARVQPGPSSDSAVWLLCSGGEEAAKVVMLRMARMAEEVMRQQEEGEEFRLHVEILSC
jgi:hypothetical protein